MFRNLHTFSLLVLITLQMGSAAFAQTSHEYRPENGLLKLQGEIATVVFSTSGGGFVDFHLKNKPNLNPLNWDSATDEKDELKLRPRGHFLCLDRWGAPSQSEQANEMPFHGEAPHVRWKMGEINNSENNVQATMNCVLPIAGLKVERSIRFPSNSSVCIVTESITNTARLGRMYNMVQHPSIAPPFLDDTTIVDSNAENGFSQADPLPIQASKTSRWPMMSFDGEETDLRFFKSEGKDGSDVSSFVFDKKTETGWVTACNPSSGLLLGYLWSTADYPWLNIWRYRQQGKVVARGLEFGTTGLHQPYPVLVKQHQILGRSLYEYIDAKESQKRSYVAFVAEVPKGFAGVKSIDRKVGMIEITESKSDNPQIIRLKLEDR